MNLDDSFTDMLHKRAKARKDYLKVKLRDNTARRQRNVLIEEQQIPDEDNKESPKCSCVEKLTLEHGEKDDVLEEMKENVSLQQQKMTRDNYIKEDKPMEEKVSLETRDLVVLREEHSPRDGLNEINVSQDIQQVEKPPTCLFSTTSRRLYSTRNRLARLAADINGWEDNLTRPSVSDTSSTEKEPAAAFIEAEDVLNCSFEPSKLPLSERKAIFEQAATENAIVADIDGWESNLMQPAVHTTCIKETPSSIAKELEDTLNSSFEPSKLPLSERKAIFEQAANNYDWKDHLMQPVVPAAFTKETHVASAKNVEDALNCSFEPSSLPLSARKAIFEKATTGNKVQSEKQTCKSKASMGQRSAIFEKSPKNKFRFRTSHQKPTNTSSIKLSKNVGNPLKPLATLRHTKPSAASAKSPGRPSNALTRSPANSSIASTERSTRQSATLSRSSSKLSITSTKSPVRLTSTLTKDPSESLTALTISPIGPTAALTRGFSKLSIAPTKNPTGPSTAITRSPADSSIASAGSTGFNYHNPAKPIATGKRTSTPTESSILKPPIFPNPQQWAKNTGTKPKIKQPLSRLVNHWEKLYSSSCRNRQLEEVANYNLLSRFK